MEVFVTGSAGYVGSRLTAHLLEGGYAVTVFGKLVYGADALLPFHRHERFKLVRGEVRELATIAAEAEGIDAIIHFAGIVGEHACAADTEQSWSI